MGHPTEEQFYIGNSLPGSDLRQSRSIVTNSQNQGEPEPLNAATTVSGHGQCLGNGSPDGLKSFPHLPSRLLPIRDQPGLLPPIGDGHVALGGGDDDRLRRTAGRSPKPCVQLHAQNRPDDQCQTPRHHEWRRCQ